VVGPKVPRYGRILSEGLRRQKDRTLRSKWSGVLPIEAFEVSRWRSAQRALLYGYSIAVFERRNSSSWLGFREVNSHREGTYSGQGSTEAFFGLGKGVFIAPGHTSGAAGKERVWNTVQHFLSRRVKGIVHPVVDLADLRGGQFLDCAHLTVAMRTMRHLRLFRGCRRIRLLMEYGAADRK
jgi:hypothetical protein